ncbi:MAG: hypothetical protein ACT4QB_18260 [Gammaproteobacteria bacterium]
MQQRGELLAEPAERLLAAVVDQVLDYVQKHRSAHTYRWYKDRLQLFLNTVPATLTLQELKPYHIQKMDRRLPRPRQRLEASCHAPVIKRSTVRARDSVAITDASPRLPIRALHNANARRRAVRRIV